MMRRKKFQTNHSKKEQATAWKELLTSLLITVGFMILFSILSSVLFGIANRTGHLETGHIDVSALFMLAVFLTARCTSGYFWAILASIIGVLLINVVYIYPYNELNFVMDGYPVVFICLTIVAIITSALSGRLKKQLQQSRQHERIARQTSEFSKRLMMVRGTEPIVRLSLEHLYRHVENTVVYVPDEMGLKEQIMTCGGDAAREIDVQERAALQQCIRTRRECGCGTAQYPDTEFRYFPLVSHAEMMGAVGIRWDDGFDNELVIRIHMSLDWMALALERQKLEDQANQSAMEAEREAMRNNLLRSISHDIRTPLTGIIGATAAILENNGQIDEENVLKLMHDVNDDAEWLLRMTENLLSVSRLTADGVTIKKQYEVVEEVIAEAVARCKRRLPEATISVTVPDELLFVPMEATLIVQVLINLIENGIRHGAPPIEVSVQQEGSNAVFLVRDFGNGFRPEEQDKLFCGAGYKKPETGRGLGIGLSLCKSIITAHGGTIEGMNHKDGGAVFRFTLPMEEEEADEIQ